MWKCVVVTYAPLRQRRDPLGVSDMHVIKRPSGRTSSKSGKGGRVLADGATKSPPAAFYRARHHLSGSRHSGYPKTIIIALALPPLDIHGALATQSGSAHTVEARTKPPRKSYSYSVILPRARTLLRISGRPKCLDPGRFRSALKELNCQPEAGFPRSRMTPAWTPCVEVSKPSRMHFSNAARPSVQCDSIHSRRRLR